MRSESKNITIETLESRLNLSGLVGSLAPSYSNAPPPVSVEQQVQAVTSGSFDTDQVVGDLNTQVSSGQVSSDGGLAATAAAAGSIEDAVGLDESYTIEHGGTIIDDPLLGELSLGEESSTTVDLDAYIDPNMAYDLAADVATNYQASAGATVGADADASAEWAATATASVDAALNAWASVASEIDYMVDITAQNGEANVAIDADVENLAASAGTAAEATATASAAASAEAAVTPTVEYNADVSANATGTVEGGLTAVPEYGIN